MADSSMIYESDSVKACKALEGKEVEGVDVSVGEMALRFRCKDNEEVIWATFGDCCSESWWADIFSLDSLRGARVNFAREIRMPQLELENEDGRSRQEFDSIYGVDIMTDKGVAKAVFRNSSNGYYGGWLALHEGSDPPDYFDYMGVTDWQWRELTGNEWSA